MSVQAILSQLIVVNAPVLIYFCDITIAEFFACDTNTLAYYLPRRKMNAKSFMKSGLEETKQGNKNLQSKNFVYSQLPGACTIKLITAVIYGFS
jgi:hypothetical protein